MDELTMSDGTKFKVNEKRLHNLCIEWEEDAAKAGYENDEDCIEGC